MNSITATPVDHDVVEAALADLANGGVAVVPGVLSAAEAADALDRLWAASGESQRRGVPTHIVNLDPNMIGSIGIAPRRTCSDPIPQRLIGR